MDTANGDKSPLLEGDNSVAPALSSMDDDSLIGYVERLSQEHEQKRYGRDNYFKDKRKKQELQDELLLKKFANEVKIFEGCIIHINGYTNPDRLTLHNQIVIHGGKFMHHLSAKGIVTHIIASNLTLKKRLEFSNYKVVKPQWIGDSIKAKKLLAWQDYSLLSDIDYGQSKLKLANLVNKNNDNATYNIDCNDPDFLMNYFKNSRLHHLSSWKSNLRSDFLHEFLTNKNVVIPKKSDIITIFHVDFDCFFATVAALIATHIDVDINKDAILVCHGSKNSDIASCNYIARDLGIRNGMWVAQAEKLCPDGMKLVCLPYNFEQFEIKSKLFYKTLSDLNLFQMVLPVSIDEAISVVINEGPDINKKFICETIRTAIYNATGGCTVSVGCSDSLVLARLALKVGKPNGYFIIDKAIENISEDLSFWSKFKTTDLPGVGYSILHKLQDYYSLGRSSTLAQLQSISNIDSLKSCLGIKTGLKLGLALKGKDDDESRKIIYDPIETFKRKSISVEINWGIRFDTIQKVDNFITRCVEYIIEKLNQLDKKTEQVTLKIMKRSKYAPVEPLKYMGMGKCDPFSKSSNFALPTNDIGVVATEVKNLFRILSCPPKELRGLSLQFNKLVSFDDDKNQLRLPLTKCIPIRVFNNLPNNLKLDVQNELDYRNIVMTTSKSPSTVSKKLIKSRFSPSKEEEKFIEELPTQLRKEVEHDLIISKKVQQSKLDEIRQQMKEKKGNQLSRTFYFHTEYSIFKPVSFQGEMSFKKICKMIRVWINGTLNKEGPHRKDLILFEKYLLKLLKLNRIHMILQLVELVQGILNQVSDNYTKSGANSLEEGYLKWERVLLKTVLPVLNRSKNEYKTKHNIDIEFNI